MDDRITQDEIERALGDFHDITLQKNFTQKEYIIAEKLKEELINACQELEEFGQLNVYGIKKCAENNKIIFEIDFMDPENNGNETIFCYY